MAVDLAKQREQFAKLKDDFARLNAKFADATKALGLKEDELEMDPAEIPPEAVKAMETAKAEAEKAGRRQVAGSFGNPEIIFADLKRPLRAVNNTLNGGERTCAHHRNFRRTASSQP